MLVRSIGAAALAAGTAQALSNSAPFFIRSTQPYVHPRRQKQSTRPVHTDHCHSLESKDSSLQLASANTVNDAITTTSRDCAASKYFIISQPGLTAADLHDSEDLNGLRLRSLDVGYASRMDITGVLGEVDAVKVVEQIAQGCGAEWEDREEANGNMWQSYVNLEEGKQIKLVQYKELPRERKERTAALSKLGTHTHSVWG